MDDQPPPFSSCGLAARDPDEEEVGSSDPCDQDRFRWGVGWCWTWFWPGGKTQLPVICMPTDLDILTDLVTMPLPTSGRRNRVLIETLRILPQSVTVPWREQLLARAIKAKQHALVLEWAKEWFEPGSDKLRQLVYDAQHEWNWIEDPNAAKCIEDLLGLVQRPLDMQNVLRACSEHLPCSPVIKSRGMLSLVGTGLRAARRPTAAPAPPSCPHTLPFLLKLLDAGAPTTCFLSLYKFYLWLGDPDFFVPALHRLKPRIFDIFHVSEPLFTNHPDGWDAFAPSVDQPLGNLAYLNVVHLLLNNGELDAIAVLLDAGLDLTTLTTLANHPSSSGHRRLPTIIELAQTRAMTRIWMSTLLIEFRKRIEAVTGGIITTCLWEGVLSNTTLGGQEKAMLLVPVCVAFLRIPTPAPFDPGITVAPLSKNSTQPSW
jgi:hypothetical protein